MDQQHQTVSVQEAARRLSVSAGTIRNWIRAGRIGATLGVQPQRPRASVWVDRDGHVLDVGGQPLQRADSAVELGPRLDHLQSQIDALKGLVASPPASRTEAFRDAALQLRAAMDHQRKALELQAEAFKELNAALTDQAAIISGFLVGDPLDVLDR